MIFLALLATTVVCACMYIYTLVQQKKIFFKNVGTPYLSPVSTFDNLAGIISKRMPNAKMIRESDNLNPDAKYVGIYNFDKPVIVLRDLELIKNVVIKNFEYFPNHDVHASKDGAMSSEKWQQYHNVLSSSLNSTKMETMCDLIHENTHTMIKRIYELAKNNPDNVYDVRDIFSKYNNDAIVNCFFGVSVDSYKDPDNNVYRYGNEGCKGHLHMVFPNLAKAMNFRTFPTKLIRYFEDLIGNVITKQNEEGIARPDFMQSMMDLKLDNSEITSAALNLFYNGQDPVTTQMCLLMYELAMSPNAQRKLQQEIDSVMIRLGHIGSELTYEILENMDFMDACINESMRLHSSTHIYWICRKSFELPPALPGLEPFIVQPGSAVWIPIIGLQHDIKIFKTPERYEPERFIHSDARAINNWSFGMGPRSCPARRFAVLEIKMAVFHILARYDLQTNDKGSYSHPAFGEFWLTFERRKKSYNKS